MATLIEKVHLIKSDPVKNNNKFWIGELYDDGNVHCNWGRVGDKGQSNIKSGGKSFLDKKVKEKMRDGRNGEIGYRKVDIIDSDVQTPKTSIVKDKNLLNIAKKQIKTKSKNTETSKLIEFLTNQNVHNIVSVSGGNIQYNYDKGMFQTPLGLVTQSTIDEARNVLDEIVNYVNEKDYGDKMLSLHRDFCMLIPQDIGRRRIEISDFWSDISKVQKQNQVLDGLQVSLVNSKKPDDNKKDKEEEIEEVHFNTDLDIVTNKNVQKKIFDLYMNNRSNKHKSYNYKPVKLWSVNIKSMEGNYKKQGSKMINIIDGYHGTGSENILSLLKTGFLVRPPSNASISGKMFGCGIYTAPCHIKGSSTKSLNYAIGYWAGRSSQRTFAFVCDVAMGKYYTPSGPCNGVPKGYDSCWAKGNYKSGVLNDETIVYKEGQINIKYLIEFEKY